MAASSILQCSAWRGLIAGILLFAGPTAMAGPGFVSDTQILEKDKLTEISVRFACGVRYIDHQPTRAGDQLRVQIESTGICRIMSPLLASNREQHRPAGADKANLVNLEYSGDTPAGQILTLNFSENVRFSVTPSPDSDVIVIRVIAAAKAKPPAAKTPPKRTVAKTRVGTTTGTGLADLMSDARRAMTAGQISKAVQIYTKVLQQAPNEHQPQAREFLALARERKGQLAHAKAEYKRYLTDYPDGEGAARVRQRLSALLTRSGQRKTGSTTKEVGATIRQRSASVWNIRTFFSQYYRRDVNQPNENNEIVSQSSLYSDANIDIRRRGKRFDISTRLTSGFRKDFLDVTSGSGNDLRVSYAYADLADNGLRIRGRVGRQSRNTGGVLGRFDGVNLSYQATQKLRLDTVFGKPVYSTADSVNDTRTFHGISSNFGPIAGRLDLGLFFLQQDISGIMDRQVVGSEIRYIDDTKSLWGLVDYDTSFKETGSMFLQGSWRFRSKLTISGLVDRRRSPFLSTGNALIGQSGLTFEELSTLLTEDELRQLALDRASSTTTVTIGLSRPLNANLQINLNASESAIGATVESGGVAATPETTYRYYSADFVASSLFARNDVSIIGARYADSDTTRVWSMNMDTRFSVGRAFRINPRLRADYRQVKSDSSSEWILTPGIRLQYRRGRNIRLEFEAGKKFAHRTFTDTTVNRQSYFINLGYQMFF